MKKLLYFVVILGLLFGIGMAPRPVASGSPSATRLGAVPGRTAQVPDIKSPSNGNPSGLKIDFGKLPLYFTANQGQVDGRARFYAKASRYTLWLTEGGLVFDSFKSERAKSPTPAKGPSLRPEKREGRGYERDVSRLIFLNAAKHPEIVPVNETALKANYFIGNDPAKWHTDVPASEAVLYKNIYDLIDLRVYGTEGRIEYDWIVRPGGDPRDIRFKYENVKRVDENGNLLIETGFGELVHKKPEAYQNGGSHLPAEGGSSDDPRTAVESAFGKIGENTYGFEMGAYEAGQDLIIDPVVLTYSTYLGGSDNEEGYGIAADGSGHAYVIGNTFSADFPAFNQYQIDQEHCDVFVTKIDTTKSGNACLVYSTYLGGSQDDTGFGIAVDGSGHAYVTGTTSSPNFPILNQYQTRQAGEDAFVTKLDTTKSGNASLIYSTYLGGNWDDYGQAIAVDGNGNAYVTGSTYSTNFPTLNGYQPASGGIRDAFVTKIDTTKSGNASLVYSSYVGGNFEDLGLAIAADAGGNAYLAGYTHSSNFPTLNQFQAQRNGYNDAFVTKLDTTKSGAASLAYSTYLGGSASQNGYGIAVDGSGNAYVTGNTLSTDFPILNQYQAYPGDGDDNVFVTKIATTQSGNASLLYSTYLGGSGYDSGRGIAIDVRGGVYVTGYTFSPNFPTLNQFQTAQGGIDAFVAKIDATKSGAASLIYSTYLGGNSNERGNGIAVDGSGNAYVAGPTYSTNFPTHNPYQSAPREYDAFIAKISTNADIAVTKASDNLTPRVGEAFHFTVTATNGGPFDATGLKIADSLPAGLTYISSAASTGTYTSATGIWDIGTLANAGAATLTIAVKGITAGSVTNTASVSALNESDPNPENNSAGATVDITNLLTIIAGPGGTTHPEPGPHKYNEGAVALIQALAATGFRFAGWSGDASGSSNPIRLTMDRDKTVIASFVRGYSLRIAAGEGGTTNPEPGIYGYAEGTSVSIQAVPAATYQFDNWAGDASGSANPLSLIMNSDKSIQAIFSRAVKPPLGLIAERLTNRNLSLVEYVVRLRWQANSANTGPISYRIYQIENETVRPIADVAAGILEYVVRRLQATRAYGFGVTAINSQGWESDMVEISAR